MSPSPYALLQASKPKPPKSVTTEYDLLSLAQNHPPIDALPEKKTSEPAQPRPFAPPLKRTHYISEIHARHAGASRSAHQQPGSL